jgi:hypothetical protein
MATHLCCLRGWRRRRYGHGHGCLRGCVRMALAELATLLRYALILRPRLEIGAVLVRPRA